MSQNVFRILFRNIGRQKLSTFLNVAGLAIGLSASLLIILWVQNELSFDRFHKNAENIYRVEEDQFYSGQRYHVTVTPQPSGPVWKEKIPEITEQTRINQMPRILFRQGDKVFFETRVIAADSGLFRMMTFPMILGNPQTALKSPYSIVLTSSMAKKYFGDQDPLGKTIQLENKLNFNVTGVIKDIPQNSSYIFDAILPFSLLRLVGAYDNNWGDNWLYTLVRLQKGASLPEVNRKLTAVVTENYPENDIKFMLFPLTDIHLKSQFGFTESHGPMTSVYIFSLIALFVIVIACINFINLSTARAATRAKEIGIKKVSGAARTTIVLQFMLESFLLVTFALALAVILTGVFLNTFNTVSGKKFETGDLASFKFIAGIILTGIVAGVLSGIYPAFYLSSFKPVVVLKGEPANGGGGRFRKILVVIQFTLSLLIACTAIFMYRQLKFMQEADLGFDRENLICIPMAESMKPKYLSLKGELLKESLIGGVTGTRSNPVMIGSNGGGAKWDGKDPQKDILIGENTIDYDYVKTMKMTIASGRDFSRDYPGDMAADSTGNFLVNEQVVKAMGIGNPVGKNFRFMGFRGTIVGVMKDFHFKGADQAIEPMAFALTPSQYLNFILIRLNGDIPSALKSVETVWKNVMPEYPLQYSFIDQDYDNLFRNSIRLAALLKYFTILAIIIACLGLYGLSSFATERRRNEIGIRKVMGAGSLIIIYTMTREFLVPVLFAIIIAVPVGWIIARDLLMQFATRIRITADIFIFMASGAVIIAFMTVSFHAYRASCINPAEALKFE